MPTAWENLMAGANASQLATFGEDVDWSGSSVPITVITSQTPFVGESTPNPNYFYLWAMLVDVPGIARGDTITRNGVVYNIIDVDPDGGGGVRVQLEKNN
jgi:hypothetical protein